LSLHTSILGFGRKSPYLPVLSNPVMRRILPGLVLSMLGDGMAVIAVGWFALELAPTDHRNSWVAIAVALYTLPATVGTMVFGRLMRNRSGAQLAGWDATLRGAALAAVPLAYVLGVLGIELYVALLATSSLLHAWGTAGRFTLVAELLPAEHRLAGNALLTIISDFTTIVGLPLAGLLIALSGAPLVFAIDAATFLILALTYRLVARASRAGADAKDDVSRSSGLRIIAQHPKLTGLVALTFGYFFLFGPVYVALPVYVADDLHASAGTLSLYYTVFGIGSVIGSFLAGYLQRWPAWPTTIGIVLVFGLTMLPLGLGAPIGVALVFFALSGVAWAPYTALSMSLFQSTVKPSVLAQVLAANGAVTVVSLPLGTLLAGPLISLFGARGALLASAAAIAGLGAIAVVAGLVLRRRFS
jgi:DHA3 family macrolide efflux protein-like MFS transporter